MNTPTMPPGVAEPRPREQRPTRRQALTAEFAVIEARVRRRAEIRSLAESLAAVDDLVAVLARSGPVFAHLGRYLGTRPDALRPEHCLRLAQTGSIRSVPPQELLPLFRQHFPDALPPWACNLREDLARSDHLLHVYIWTEVPELSFFVVDLEFRRAWPVDRPLLLLAERVASLLWPHAPFRRLVEQFERDVARSLAPEWDLQSLRRAEAFPPPNPDGRPAFAAPRYAEEFSLPSLLAVRAPRLSAAPKLFNGSRGTGNDQFDEGTSASEMETARLVCLAWLNHALKHAWFPESPRPAALALTEQGRFALLGGRMATMDRDLQAALLRYLAAVASGRTDDAAAAIISICATEESSASYEKVRTLFRQMVPFRDGGWGRLSRQETLAEHVFAHLRITAQVGYRIPEGMIHFVRGFWEIARLAHEIAPEHDLLREASQQFRAANAYDRLRGLLTQANLGGQGQDWLQLMLELPEKLNAIAARKRFDEAIGISAPPRPRLSPWPAAGAHILVLGSIGLLLTKLAEVGAASEWLCAIGLVAFVAVAYSFLILFRETR